jgi:GNAT superfamily N-acetyltransferase
MIEIERLESFTDQDIKDLAKLGDALFDFDGKIDARVLDFIVSHPDSHVQIVARSDGRIVGAATLSIVSGALVAGNNAYLQDFSVSSEIQGQGIGGKVWDEMILWCKENQVQRLEFTSRPAYANAHKFYEKRGATIRDTDAFKVDIA